MTRIADPACRCCAHGSNARLLSSAAAATGRPPSAEGAVLLHFGAGVVGEGALAARRDPLDPDPRRLQAIAFVPSEHAEP